MGVLEFLGLSRPTIRTAPLGPRRSMAAEQAAFAAVAGPPEERFRTSPDIRFGPFAVSWQCWQIEKLHEAIARDLDRDFLWWTSDRAQGPMLVECECTHDSAIQLADFEGREHGTWCAALQIDILRPKIDYLELRYPGRPLYFLLDTDVIAANNFARYPGLQRDWLALSTTTENDTPVSALRRTMWFPQVEKFNERHGTAYRDIAPSRNFANTYEDWLNREGVKWLEDSHWDYHFSGSPPAQLDSIVF